MPSTSTFSQRVADAKANYRLVKLLRDAADDAAEAADTAERTYTNLGGSLSGRDRDQINNDWMIVMNWVTQSAPPTRPQPGRTAREQGDEAIQWERIGRQLKKILDDYRRHGVGEAVRRLINAAEKLRRAIDRQRGVPEMGPNRTAVAHEGPSNRHVPDPHNTGAHNTGYGTRLGGVGEHGAQLGFNLGGIKGGGGAIGGGATPKGGSSFGSADPSTGPGGYGTGYGGDGGLGHESGGGGGAGWGGGGGAGVGGGGGAPGGGSPSGSQGDPIPASPQSGVAGGITGDAAAGWGQDSQDKAQDNASSLGQLAGDAWDPAADEATADEASGLQSAGEQAADYLNSLSSDPSPPGGSGDTQQQGDAQPPDPQQGGGSSGSPNPDDGSDESPRMRGLPRRRGFRADKFTGTGAVPAQTSAVLRLLAFSSAGLGDDGGGVNPRFFGADPDSDRSTGRRGRAAEPDDGGGGHSDTGAYGTHGGGVGGGDQGTFGWQGGTTDGLDPDAGNVGFNDPSGPDPDNEWGAGGYNPHYQPWGGYVWTPYSRGAAAGTTRATPVLPARVQRAAAVRFK